MQVSGTLKWWVLVVTTLAVSAYCYTLGLFHSLWQVDISKVSFAIIALFIGVTCFIGVLTRRVERWYHIEQDFVNLYIKPCQFSTVAMTELGMIGTVVGFLIMLGPAFSGADILTNPQSAIAKMAIGMATALTTTLVGLVCSLLTKIQLVNLETMIDAHEQQEEEDKEE